MKTTWQSTYKEIKKYPKLQGNINTDVVIVGGGITGTTLAYLLAKKNKKVVVLEKGTLGESSTTAYTTAFLTCQIDTDYQDLQKMFGHSQAKAIWDSHQDSIDEIEKIIGEEKIDCEFMRCDTFLFGRTKGDWEKERGEIFAAKAAGFPILLDEDKEKAKLPFPHQGYAVLKNQAKFHPLKYVNGLRQAAEKYGALFFENSEVINIESDKPVRVHTKENLVTGKWVAITTYRPFNKPKELFARSGMYESYIYELSIPKSSLKEGLYIDSDNPYHYFRIDKGQDASRLIIGGEDHRSEIKMSEEKNYKALLHYAEKILGKNKYIIKTKWRGGILESTDGLPWIGSYSYQHPSRLVATGFSGNGMTYSMVASRILHDQILGVPNNYASLYNPKRKYWSSALLVKARDYIGEFFNGALRNILFSH